MMKNNDCTFLQSPVWFFDCQVQDRAKLVQVWSVSITGGFTSSKLRHREKQPPEVFFNEKFAKFTGIHLCYSLFFNKEAGLSLQFY